MADTEYKQKPWSLDDLFAGPDSPEIQRALDAVEEKVQQFETWRPKLSAELEAEQFSEILRSYDHLVTKLSRLLGFASLSFSADTQDQQALARLSQFRQLAAESENRTLFFKLWWKALDDDLAEQLLDAAGDYRYWLEALRLERPYTLSEAEEKVINIKDVNGSQALTTLYSSITNRYVFKLEVEGEEKEMTREELSTYARHSDPDLRAASFQEQFRVYGQDAPILGQIYQYRVRDWHSEHVGLRKFASPMAVRNLYNDIPDDVVDTLIDVSQANAPLFQRYFRLKARWLGMEKLRRYDIYAPLAQTEKRVDFGDAVDLVLDSFRRFEPEVGDLAERVFAEKHLDSEVRKGKRGGAFCSTVVPELTPWVLQSYNGRLRDVTTMAHELGHAVHAMLASHHTILTQHASLPLAETASTFSEMLVIDRLLAEDPEPETRRDLLFQQMDDNYATIMRQIYFAIFERDAHDRIIEGASIDDLSKLYADNLASQFGDSLDVSEDFHQEWVVVPHFYATPFYVYAYSFGQLLVLSLYQQYLEEADSFKPRYLKLLSAGGSDSPENTLVNAGIDIHSEAFWQGGYDILLASLEELESLEIPQTDGN